MKRRFALLCALCALLGAALPVPAEDLAPAWTQVKTNLRAGAGTNTPVRSVLPGGAQVSLLGWEGDWYIVAYGQTTGYIRQDLLLTGQQGAPAPPASSSPASTARTLRYGAKGDDVLALQQRLVALGYGPLNPTGSYMTNTVACVKAFQRTNRLGADGIAGPKTLAALYAETGVPATTPPPAASGGDAQTSALLRSGSAGDAVRALQLRLKELGYFTATATGTYASLTAAAVRAFQRANGLLADGIAGPKTLTALYGQAASSPGTQPPDSAAPTATPRPASTPRPGYPTLRKGSTGEDVRALQQALKDLGYYTGSVNGNYDSATADAVRAFQQNNDTGVDGVAGPATLRILYEGTPLVASQKPTPRPTLTPGAGEMDGPDPSQVELAHWFNDVKKSYKAGQNYTVYDPASGLGWGLRFYAMGNHADSEPRTRQDTEIMYAAFGYATTWNPKPVFARMPDGRWILATMHNTPHLSGSIQDNGFDGHLCVHFYRDMDEVIKNDPNYGVQNQNVLRAYWEKMR
ncbi:MAG: peptidoglycan-binding protein [Oscillospiraceae bacterium]|jgi:peptidoglycan hydrolase-like protein with peptidoglycan-binding domain|nr:peptidoglycan-binding protein [Oscillospiraceae bacterium]